MELNEYQKRAAEYDFFEPNSDMKSPGLIEKVLGLAGEAGETADKVKKIIRDKDGRVSEEDRDALVKELGDVLWYVANVARYLDASLSEVAETNLTKLGSRKKRGKLRGSGDER